MTRHLSNVRFIWPSARGSDEVACRAIAEGLKKRNGRVGRVGPVDPEFPCECGWSIECGDGNHAFELTIELVDRDEFLISVEPTKSGWLGRRPDPTALLRVLAEIAGALPNTPPDVISKSHNAEWLARALIADLVQFHEEDVLSPQSERLAELIETCRATFSSRVTPEIAESDLFEDCLGEALYEARSGRGAALAG